MDLFRSLLNRDGRVTASAVAQSSSLQTPRPPTIIAAAMPVTGPEGRQAWRARSGNEAWIREVWYFYDSIGEVRFATNWIANAMSRATIFAAEKDPQTGLLTGPTENPAVQAIASSMLGGASRAPRLLRTMSLHLQVAGETFILVRPQTQGRPDEWCVLPSKSLKESGGTWSYIDPFTGVWRKLTRQDNLIRVWSPHPLDHTYSDSAMRAALPILSEIEKTSQNIASRLDSRLAGNGLLFIPNEIDFPRAENEPADAQAFVKLLLDAAEASLSNPGSAAGQVPITAQVPGELIGQIQHLDISTQFDASIVELRAQGFTRLGRALDMPKEIALSEMSEANHWSAWQIEEMTYKIHIEPGLSNIGSSLTEMIFYGLLEAAGVPDPTRYVLDWDITEVTARPDRGQDLRELYDRGLISDDYMRAENGIPDDAIPTDEEFHRKLAEKLALASPSVLENPSVAEAIGFEPSESSESSVGSGDSDDSDSDDAGQDSRALPERPSEPDSGLVAAAELVVFDALSRAGGRLLTREYRGKYGGVPKHELHTVIPTDDLPKLMEGSFQFAAHTAQAFHQNPEKFEVCVRAYVENRLSKGEHHDRETLRRFL